MRTLRAFVSTLAFATGALALSGVANAQSAFGDPLFAVLVGGNECDAGAVCKKGDADAIGSVTLIFPDANTVCWGLTIDNIGVPNAAHIHAGTAAVNGAPVVTLIAPSSGNPGASSGCIKEVPAATTAAIRKDPTSFYVNVHNNAFPNGAARGQLH